MRLEQEDGMAILAGKSALITGGGGGFGKACALRLAQDGAAITLMGRTEAKLAACRDLVLQSHPEAQVCLCPGDGTKETDVKAAVAATIANGGSLDIVVATVGGGGGYGSVLESSYETFMSDLKMNVGSAFLTVRHGAAEMNNGGAFVFISSTAAKLAFLNLTSYCAGKAALDHFMRAAANELGGRNIRLNAVRPGLTHTDGMDALFGMPGYVDGFKPMIPLGRTGVPMDIAEAVRFLAGPESAWVTGQSFAVDGGNELRGAPLG
jgi:NAD(P)-dependent dehydrogenase (short-subunit alcohol dehydrogenase family)